MTGYPQTDWDSFADDIDDNLQLASEQGLTTRDIQHQCSISISSLSRARNGQVVSVANFLALCLIFELDPFNYLAMDQTMFPVEPILKRFDLIRENGVTDDTNSQKAGCRADRADNA